MRKKIVAGNWKMNKLIGEATDLAEAVKREIGNLLDVDVVLCPPATALKTVGDVITGTHIDLGAQNMHWEKSGAFTGEISPSMLRDLYCHYVILGHSERRQYFGETNESVNRKARAAHANHLTPIVCVGETLAEREGGTMVEVITRQVKESLFDLTAKELASSVVAYEPVWAIGTGKTATAQQAQDVHALIRKVLAEISDTATAESVRIQYGGSVKGSNAKELFTQPDIDGGLIGGAALEARSFIEIVKAAVSSSSEG